MSLKFILPLLLLATIAFADECESLCSECENDKSEICANVIKTCGCDYSTAQQEETADVKSPSKSTVIDVDFDHNEENKAPIKKNIIDVNFGDNGDMEHTAVKKSDGSYEIEKRSNKGLIAASAAVVIAIIIFLAI